MRRGRRHDHVVHRVPPVRVLVVTGLMVPSLRLLLCLVASLSVYSVPPASNDCLESAAGFSLVYPQPGAVLIALHSVMMIISMSPETYTPHDFCVTTHFTFVGMDESVKTCKAANSRLPGQTVLFSMHYPSGFPPGMAEIRFVIEPAGCDAVTSETFNVDVVRGYSYGDPKWRRGTHVDCEVGELERVFMMLKGEFDVSYGCVRSCRLGNVCYEPRTNEMLLLQGPALTRNSDLFTFPPPATGTCRRGAPVPRLKYTVANADRIVPSPGVGLVAEPTILYQPTVDPDPLEATDLCALP